MLKHLQKYIGEEVTYNGTRCQLIEVLEEGPSLVLMCIEHHTTIQTDQHGGAHRRVQETFTITCLSEVSTELHPVVKEFLPDHIHDDFLDYLVKL